MKTVFLKTITITALLGFLVPAFAFAQTPSLPHQFFGTVKFTDGVMVPNGRTVEAKINGSVVGISVTVNENYGYNPNLLFATDNKGVNAGKTVEFYVGGTKANETATFTNGNSNQLNLTIPAPSPPPAPPVSSGGSSSGGSSTPPPVSPLSAAAQVVDTNGDDKIDILDFNSLVINWGKTGSGNVADFDNNGTVDIFDFNLLMTYWTG